MEALETFILRSREFGRSAAPQHLTLLGNFNIFFYFCVLKII